MTEWTGAYVINYAFVLAAAPAVLIHIIRYLI